MFFLQQLEKDIVVFMKNEFERFQRDLNPDNLECSKSHNAEEEEGVGCDEMQRSRKAFLSITLHFLRRMKQDKLADCLKSSKRISFTKQHLRSLDQCSFEYFFIYNLLLCI